MSWMAICFSGLLQHQKFIKIPWSGAISQRKDRVPTISNQHFCGAMCFFLGVHCLKFSFDMQPGGKLKNLWFWTKAIISYGKRSKQKKETRVSTRWLNNGHVSKLNPYGGWFRKFRNPSQLRLVVSPIIYRVLAASLGFLPSTIVLIVSSGNWSWIVEPNLPSSGMQTVSIGANELWWKNTLESTFFLH